jgi:hypothetical protein
MIFHMFMYVYRYKVLIVPVESEVQYRDGVILLRRM